MKSLYIGALLVTGATYVGRNEIREYVGLPWESSCERFDRRCQSSYGNASQFTTSVMCSFSGMLIWVVDVSKKELACRELNKKLDEVRWGAASPSEPIATEGPKQTVVVIVDRENIRLSPNGAIVGIATRSEAFKVLGREGNWVHIERVSGNAYIWGDSVR